jgi:hypothetical protein
VLVKPRAVVIARHGKVQGATVVDDVLGPDLNPALVKAIAKVAEECLGADHAVTKAFGVAANSTDRATVDLACELFRQLPAGQRNMLWITAKSVLGQTAKKGELPYTDADLSPNRVLH